MLDQKLELTRVAESALQELINKLDPTKSNIDLQNIKMPALALSHSDSLKTTEHTRKNLGIESTNPMISSTSQYDKDKGHGFLDIDFYAHDKSMIGIIGPLNLTNIVLNAPKRLQKTIMIYHAAHALSYLYDPRWALAYTTFTNTSKKDDNSEMGCNFFNERFAYIAEGTVAGIPDFEMHLDWFDENAPKNRNNPMMDFLITGRLKYEAEISGNFEGSPIKLKDLLNPVAHMINSTKFNKGFERQVDFIENFHRFYEKVKRMDVKTYPVQSL